MVVANSAIIVFREGLEAVLILAAVMHRCSAGSYFLAEYVRVRAPRRRGGKPAVRTSEPSLELR